MNISPPPVWLVVGSVLGCIFVLEYLQAVNLRTDFATSFYPGQAELIKALSEDHAIVPVSTFIIFEAIKKLDP